MRDKTTIVALHMINDDISLDMLFDSWILMFLKLHEIIATGPRSEKIRFIQNKSGTKNPHDLNSIEQDH